MQKWKQGALAVYNRGRSFVAPAVGGALVVIGTGANAALDAEVTTALADMKTDATTVAVAFLVLAILIASYKAIKSSK